MNKLNTLNKFEKTHGFQRHKIVDASICPYFCLQPYYIQELKNSTIIRANICAHLDLDPFENDLSEYRYCVDCHMWEFWMDIPEEEWN